MIHPVTTSVKPAATTSDTPTNLVSDEIEMGCYRNTIHVIMDWGAIDSPDHLRRIRTACGRMFPASNIGAMSTVPTQGAEKVGLPLEHFRDEATRGKEFQLSQSCQSCPPGLNHYSTSFLFLSFYLFLLPVKFADQHFKEASES